MAEYRIRETGAVMFEGELRSYLAANDGPSFDVLTSEVMEAIGVDPVLEGPQAVTVPPYQFSQRAGVESIGGQWFTKYVAGPIFTDTTDADGAVITAAEQEAGYRTRKDAEQAKAVRDDRNKRLADCDWTQLPDSPVNKQEWASYRATLRDITVEAGFPWDVEWPVAPAG